MGENLGDFVGDRSCFGEGATHHLACDCRERKFATLEANYREAIYLLEKVAWIPALDPQESRCGNCFSMRAQGHKPTCRIGFLVNG